MYACTVCICTACAQINNYVFTCRNIVVLRIKTLTIKVTTSVCDCSVQSKGEVLSHFFHNQKCSDSNCYVFWIVPFFCLILRNATFSQMYFYPQRYHRQLQRIKTDNTFKWWKNSKCKTLEFAFVGFQWTTQICCQFFWDYFLPPTILRTSLPCPCL